MNVCMRETKTGRCVFASLYLFVPVHSPKRVFTLWGHLHVQVTVLQDEPTDSSAQTEFPCKLFPPFVWGDEENGLISASDCSNFISISKWASSCVSFCTISKSFCYCFIFLLLFTKMAETFSHAMWCILSPRFHFCAITDCPGAMIFRLHLLEKCWYFWLPTLNIHHINGF